MLKILEGIKQPNDIKYIPAQYRKILAEQIRSFLVNNVSKTGGHLAPNLGVVELTMALHLCMDFPKDKLIWDVGHQAYTHKILTGRKNEFTTLRQMGGLCGFPKMTESDCDAFSAGHSSTSIAAAVGYAKGRDLQGEKYKIAAVIGDGALSGGMAYEALNNAARLKSNLVIVLNDNNMSISENVGGMASYLGKIRVDSAYSDFKGNVESAIRSVPKVGNAIASKIKNTKDSLKRLVIPGMLFEDMGLTYMGPIDGHDVDIMVKAFKTAFSAKKPVIVHVVTKKGKGYEYAMKNPSKFHGVDPFDPATGEFLNKSNEKSYTDVFSKSLIDRASRDEKIFAITAAMPTGTGLDKFKESFPDRFSDVGIAEEYAVTYAAGMAAAGMTPVVAIYSTFMQRAYDQILHDVCLNKLHVILAVDRAGLVGKDGATHQGMYDLSYLTSIPGLCVMAPSSGKELKMMLEYACDGDGPFAIRYPRGEAYKETGEIPPIENAKGYVCYETLDAGTKKCITILAIGSMVEKAVKVASNLEKENVAVKVVNMRFAAPLDVKSIEQAIKNSYMIVTMEENEFTGGFGQQAAQVVASKGYESNCRFVNISLPDDYIEHGDVQSLYEKYGLSVSAMTQKIVEEMKKQ